jgi:hypothetical protein
MFCHVGRCVWHESLSDVSETITLNTFSPCVLPFRRWKFCKVFGDCFLAQIGQCTEVTQQEALMKSLPTLYL